MNDFVRLLATGTTTRRTSLTRNNQTGYNSTNILEESILANIKDKCSISIKVKINIMPLSII